jgi:chemotaxis protein MotB
MNREPPKSFEGIPEWMVSYADMITIMMAFFVVMYALSGKKDESSLRPVLSALKQQFGPRWPYANLLPGFFRPRNPHFDRLNRDGTPTGKAGRGAAADDPAARPARMFRPAEGLVRGGCIFFEDSSVALSRYQKLQLQRVVAELSGKPQKIEIRGHASRRPLPPDAPFRDHWDLAYARSRAALEYLVAQGIDPKRIRMAVAGSHEPPLPNEGDAPTSAVARVEIFLLNEFVDGSN